MTSRNKAASRGCRHHSPTVSESLHFRATEAAGVLKPNRELGFTRVRSIRNLDLGLVMVLD